MTEKKIEDLSKEELLILVKQMEITQFRLIVENAFLQQYFPVVVLHQEKILDYLDRHLAIMKDLITLYTQLKPDNKPAKQG